MGDVNAAVERLLGGGLQVKAKILILYFCIMLCIIALKQSNFQGQSLG